VETRALSGQTMRAYLALFILVAVGSACLAGEIRVGAAMQVKPYLVWFQDADKFAGWQALKQSGDTKAFAAYQKQALHQRDAWQFINQQAVKILKVEPEKNRVDVEMTGAGRLQGTKWLLDVDALVE
jgi:hypothetical protein